MTDNTSPETIGFDRVYRRQTEIDHESFARAEKSGQLISGLKYVLPVVALILIAVFLYLSGAFAPSHKIENDKFLAEIDNIQLKKDSAKMHNLKLVGRGAEDGNYELTAGTATRKISEPHRYYLDIVDAVMKKSDGSWTKIRAKTGVYDKKADVLKLRRNVEIESKKGYVARMEAARVLVEKGELISEAPVEVTLPDGNVTAKHMEVIDRGRVFRFRGRPKMVMNMSGGKNK